MANNNQRCIYVHRGRILKQLTMVRPRDKFIELLHVCLINQSQLKKLILYFWKVKTLKKAIDYYRKKPVHMLFDSLTNDFSYNAMKPSLNTQS